MLSFKRSVRTFMRMKFKNKLLFIANFILCGVARASINLFSLPRLAPYFGAFYKTTTVSMLISEEQTRRAFKIGQSVRLAAKYTPWDSSCLTQAMVAKFWCRMYKIPYVLYIGFAKAEDEPHGFRAHAWLTAGRVALTGGHSLPNFHVVSSYIGV